VAGDDHLVLRPHREISIMAVLVNTTLVPLELQVIELRNTVGV
jgi:hypothetical protein